MKRLSRRIRDLQDTVNVLQEAAEFKDPEPADGEVPGGIFNSIVNRNHVSEANLAGLNVASLFFESLTLNSTTYYRDSEQQGHPAS